MTYAQLLPEPKHICPRDGRFVFGRSCTIAVHPQHAAECQPAVTVLVERLRQLAGIDASAGVDSTGPGEASLQLAIVSPDELVQLAPQALTPVDTARLSEEGYSLSVAPDEIRFVAATGRGLYCAAQTFAQLIGVDRTVGCVEIVDWPAMPMRGLFIILGPDLRWYPGAQTPTLEYLKGLVRTLSEYKLNTLVIEYADRFSYESHPDLNHKEAFSRDEIRELVSFADDHRVQIIPLLQCLGHLDYMLVHKEYAHLREGGDEGRQICPLNSESLTLWTELAGEIMELHPNSRYFHVGGDETRELGACPRCRKEVARIGPGGLYVNHVAKVVDCVKRNGKTPIVWDDMLCAHPETLDQLDKDVMLMYWDYSTLRESGPFLEVRAGKQGTHYDKSWQVKDMPELEQASMATLATPADMANDLPSECMTAYRDYFGDGFPRHIEGFPYLRCYQDKGFKVVGASCVYGVGLVGPGMMGTGNIYPSLPHAAANTTAFCRKVARESAEGLVTTWWMSEAIPLELSWYQILLAADYAWGPREYSRRDFDRRFVKQYHGTDDTPVVDAMFMLEGGSIPYAQSYMNPHATLDDEIAAFESREDVAEQLDHLRRRKEQAVRCLEMLDTVWETIGSHRLPLHHLRIAARTTIHKINQVLTFHEVVANPSASGLDGRLEELKRELLAVREETNRVFRMSMKPSSVAEELIMRYGKAVRAIDEYLRTVTKDGTCSQGGLETGVNEMNS